MSPEALAARLLQEFKGGRYLRGRGVLPGVGEAVRRNGTRAVLIRDSFPGSDAWTAVIRASLKEAGVTVLEEVDGPGPNAPRQDVQRITARIAAADPRWS
jgi:hypothetical protein